MKKKLISIYEYVIALFSIIVLKFNSLTRKKKIYIFGVPQHGNIGDQAILVGELAMIKNELPEYKAINVSSKYVLKFPKLAKKIVKNDIILYTGGGFLGSLWINEEHMFRNVLKLFHENKIIAMPQTFYFSSNSEGKTILEESKIVYSKCKNLSIICREKYSYNFMKENFQKLKIFLLPDMALYLNTLKYNINKSNILLCLRNDKEKIDSNHEELLGKLSVLKKFNVDKTDTVIKKSFIFKNRTRTKIILNKIKEFSNYKLVITDRLHGMIFAYLAKTPCLVIDSKSYKVRGVHEWIKESNYIKFCNNENLDKQIDELISLKEKKLKEVDLKKNYLNIVKLIKDGGKNG